MVATAPPSSLLSNARNTPGKRPVRARMCVTSASPNEGIMRLTQCRRCLLLEHRQLKQRKGRSGDLAGTVGVDDHHQPGTLLTQLIELLQCTVRQLVRVVHHQHGLARGLAAHRNAQRFGEVVAVTAFEPNHATARHAQ